MITLNLGEIARWAFCIIAPLILAIIGGNAGTKKWGGIVLFAVIFILYWTLASVGLYHISLVVF
jgi:hypothetical protein